MRKFYQLTFCSMLALFTFGLNFAVFGQLGTIQIGSGTSISTGSQGIPVTNYDFSYSQQIVTAAQYAVAGGATGPITKIRYYCTDVGTVSNWDTWTVLLGNTSKTSFTSDTDWVPLAELTEVFNGVITPVANDWFEITFTTPFNYTGGNIVVAIDENKMGFSSYPTFRSFTSGANTGILARRDGAANNIDPAAPPTANYRGSNVPQIQFEGTLATCPMPSNLASSNVLDNSVDLSWTAGGTETSWNIQWGTPGFTPGTGTEIGSAAATATTATVNGLSEQTAYQIYIQADCGAGDESLWIGPISVTTIQTPASLPYLDDFSTSEWVLSNGSQTNAWYVGAAEGNPANGLYISNDGGTTNAYTISSASSTVHASKVFELPAGTGPFNVSFDWKATGESTHDYLRVWLVPATAALIPGTSITTGNTPGAVRISNQYLNGVTEWQTANLEIPASYAGSIVKIVFEWRNDGSVGTNPPAAVDNIAFTEITCVAPTALTASNITENSVDLSWTSGGTETSWNIEWGTPGFIPGTGAELGSAAATDTTTTVNGLSEQTTYHIYIQADCGPGDESHWVGPLSVTTIQIPVSLPYSDDFSTSEWVLSNGSQTNKWFIGSATGNPANSLYVTNDNGVTNAYTISSASSVVHATKTVAFPAGNPFTLEFDWKSAGESDYDYLRVWLIPATANPTPGTQVSATNIPGSLQLGGNHQTTTAWTTASYTIPDSYAGTTAKLVFEWRNDGGTGTNPPAAVDNISITQIACVVPSALVSSNTTENSFDVSWTPGGTETQWNVAWGLSGFTPGDTNQIGSDVATSASYTINGLTENTAYDVYVQADCGAGDLSYWAGPVEVLTYCSSIPAIGFCEDFEDIDALGCWRIINANEDSDAWSIYTGYANSGVQSAGLDTDYNAGDNDDYLVLPRMTLTGNEVLTFHYRARSSYEPNDFRVVLSTTGAEAADFTEVILPLMTISNTTYQDTSVNLSAYSGDVYIAFHVPPGGLDGYYVYIDDVCVDVCTPVAGIDGDTDVCRLDGTVDLNTVITSPYTHGTWSSATHPSMLNGSSFDVSTLANGAYELMYVVTTACTADTTIATVNVLNPSSAGEDGMLTACKNQMVDLFGGLSGTVDFGGTWYTSNGTPLTSSYFQTGTLVGQTIYKYVVSNGTCPADTSEVMLNIQNCDFLGLDDVSLLDNVSIAPNPNTGKFRISGVPGSDYTFEVIDLNGRIVRPAKEITATVTDVNLTDVESGVYMIRIAGNNSERMIRVIKQ